MKDTTRENLSRRGFLAGAGVLGLGALAACTPSGKETSNGDGGGSGGAGGGAEPTWDKTVDVLVVGSGTVAIAGLVAKELGAGDVLLIEKANVWGGTTATSGGGLWIPGAYCQAAENITDDIEAAVKYAISCSFGRCDPKLPETYVRNANPFIEWTRDAFGWEWGLNGHGFFQDYFEPIEGFLANGRGNVGLAGLNGPGFWAVVQEKATELGVEVMMETAGTSLYTNEDGDIIGVKAKAGSGDLNIKVNKAVFLGTGGFDHNPDMVRRYQPVRPYISNAAPGNTGDGQNMGVAIGADLGTMDKNWGLPCFYPANDWSIDKDPLFEFTGNDWATYRGKPNAVVVNKYGRRFGNEASAYAVFNRSWESWDSYRLEYTNLPAYFICDATYLEHYTLPGQKAVGDPVPEFFTQAETLAELAGKLGIDESGLLAEIAEFNTAAAEGNDPRFGRGSKNFDRQTSGDATGRDLPNSCLAPLEKGPFYGAIYVPGTCGTNGGLVVNEKAQVLRTDGSAIKGLYAVGNCSSGWVGGSYCGGGMTVGQGCVMSWIGVKHALNAE
jgi:succinate dehydrogenase/fumarate reductase flavoprotein subunit